MGNRRIAVNHYCVVSRASMWDSPASPSDAVTDNVKVIRIAGKLPSDEGYPLK